MNTSIKPSSWGMAAFGVPTWELLEYFVAALQQSSQATGHYTIKVVPLADKWLLHKCGFYCCDTLNESHCSVERSHEARHSDAFISKKVDNENILAICLSAFVYGRFHRDFNLAKAAADLRYDNWLKQLLKAGHVYGLYWQGVLAGFIGHSGNNLVLHALAEQYRGKGLSKYWWSAVCIELLALGYDKVKSSISFSNLAVLNLYASMVFSFRYVPSFGDMSYFTCRN